MGPSPESWRRTKCLRSRYCAHRATSGRAGRRSASSLARSTCWRRYLKAAPVLSLRQTRRSQSGLTLPGRTGFSVYFVRKPAVIARSVVFIEYGPPDARICFSLYWRRQRSRSPAGAVVAETNRGQSMTDKSGCLHTCTGNSARSCMVAPFIVGKGSTWKARGHSPLCAGPDSG